ncbi:MAG: response regulator transcription factor [Saprospiraceae bacterium]|nr:MAG: response regulator transcription factor [Saprospiraceae bacterium]
MVNAIIVEDELKSMNNLKNLLSQHCPEVKVIGEATNIEQGLKLFLGASPKPNVAFLDISLPDGLVFKMLDELRPIDFEVIFITAFNEHAIKACQYSSIGYILKPINPDSLVQAVNRIRISEANQIGQRLDLFSQQLRYPNSFEKISVSAIDGIYFVNIKDIVRFEAEDNYTHIFLVGGGKITVSKTIKAYEDMLINSHFYRVHKRHVINLNFMRKLVKGDGGYLVMEDGIKIEVSRRRRPAFMEQMRRLEEGL